MVLSLRVRRIWLFIGLYFFASGIAGAVNNYDTTGGILNFGTSIISVVIGSALISWFILDK